MLNVAADGVTMHWLMEDRIQANAGLNLACMTVEPGKISEAHRLRIALRQFMSCPGSSSRDVMIAG